MWSKFHPFWINLNHKIQSFFGDRLTIALMAYVISLGINLNYPFPTWIWILLLIAGGIGYCFYRSKLILGWICIVLLWMGLGGIQIELRQQLVNAHPLSSPWFHTQIQGTIESVQHYPDKQILIMNRIQPTFFHSDIPNKVRLHYSNTKPTLATGQKIQTIVSLFAPHQNQAPYIPQMNQLLFRGIGATGVIHQIPKIIDHESNENLFSKLRQTITQRLQKSMSPNSAQIAIPLITGDQSFVSPEQYQTYRQSGLTHVLSVSGFHMALLAGLLFFIIRSLCCLYSPIALHINSKKVAAILAELGTAFYLLLSDVQIPALRSFIMISIVFLGIIVDRPAFSKRSLFITAFALLLWCPENILSISFQLSFMAVLILITTHEWIHTHTQTLGKTQRNLLEFLLLNIMITIGLSPLIAWHFNCINPYGVIGNILFSFVFSLLLMPLLFLGCLLIPMHLENIPFQLADWILSHIEVGAKWVGSWPKSEILISSYPGLFLSLIVMGIVCFTLYRTKWSSIILWSIALIGIGLTAHPVILVAEGGKSIAYSENETLKSTGDNSYLNQLWQQKLGLKNIEVISKPPIIQIQNQKIALNPNQCIESDLAILSQQDSRCRIPTLIPNRDTTYFIYFKNNQLEVRELNKP